MSEETAKIVTLANLQPSPGSHRNRKRIGRGIGSGTGKTAGKGHKGQKARKGGGIAPGFEGGQTPLYRRLPKRGFKSRFNPVEIVGLKALKRFEGKGDIGPKELSAAGLISSPNAIVKLLANGDVSLSGVNLKVHRMSKTAKELCEKSGLKVELLENKRTVLEKFKKKSRT